MKQRRAGNTRCQNATGLKRWTSLRDDPENSGPGEFSGQESKSICADSPVLLRQLEREFTGMVCRSTDERKSNPDSMQRSAGFRRRTDMDSSGFSIHAFIGRIGRNTGRADWEVSINSVNSSGGTRHEEDDSSICPASCGGSSGMLSRAPVLWAP